MEKILVTGATGFTGGHLARKLIDRKCEVHCLARPGKDALSLERAGCRIVRGDLTKKDTLEAAVRGMEKVYHVAALYREENVPRPMFRDVNVGGTRNLLEACLQAGVKRFVHCSTVGVQGEIDKPPATEEAPYRPGDAYQESKMEGELMALDFYAKRGLPVVVFRPVGIYGPGDTRFLKLFRNVRFGMFGSGEVLYHLTYIDDLTDGICLVGTVPGIEGQIFTLAGERYTTLNELYAIIAEVLNVPLSRRHYPVWPVYAAGAVCEWLCRPFRISPPIYRRRLDFFIKDRAFDIGKARRMLGYKPAVDLKTGITRTAEWYKQRGLLH
jgi:nucleoside-diphosphate-sugar epimerase